MSELCSVCKKPISNLTCSACVKCVLPISKAYTKGQEAERLRTIKILSEKDKQIETMQRIIGRLCGKKDKYIDYIGNAIKEPEKEVLK